MVRAISLLGLLTLALGGVFASACSSGGEGGENQGEAPLVAFNDPNNQISISYPSTWQKTSDDPLTFTGQDEFLEIEIRQNGGSDPLTVAKADQGSIEAGAPGFKLLGVAASKEVNNSAVISYTWELPRSAVTGKPVAERADTYFIDLGDGRMAVLTGSSPKTTFDREQVRDIALTLKVNK
jgi:hypothetical protein